MSARSWLWVVPLVAAWAAGCSGPKEADIVAKHPAPPAKPRLPAATVAAVLPTPAAAMPVIKEKDTTEFIPPFLENVDLFAPPKDPVPAAPPPEAAPAPAPVPTAVAAPVPAEKKPRPPLRLVGFVNVSTPKALLSLDGTLSAVTAGETIRDVEIVAIEPPSVTLKFADEEYSVNLLERSEELSRPGVGAPRSLPLLPRGPAMDRAVRPPVSPSEALQTSTPPAPPVPAPVAATAPGQPPSVPPLPSAAGDSALPKLPPLPDASAIQALRDLPKLP